MISNHKIQQSNLKVIQIADEYLHSEYVASIKISRQPNGTVLGAAVFIPGDIIAGIAGDVDIVKLRITRQNNNIILGMN